MIKRQIVIKKEQKDTIIIATTAYYRGLAYKRHIEKKFKWYHYIIYKVIKA